MKKINYPKILDLIGNTPIAKLDFGTKATFLAKLEYLNPGGSIKDRAALFMIEEAERNGSLKPGGTIVEASSGNQGIALAMIGALKGYKVIITVPNRTSKEKVATLNAYGAQVYVCKNTATLDDPESYHSKAEHFAHTIPGAFMPNQYYNVSNPKAHYLTTGPEIWNQTNGTITHFICAMGSCGTISGVAKYLKEKNPSIKIIGVDSIHSKLSSKNPKPYQSEGIGVDIISETLNKSVIDEIFLVDDPEAFETTKNLAQKHGILVGLSSGALMSVAIDYVKKLSDDSVVVIILADSGRAYLSKVFGL